MTAFPINSIDTSNRGYVELKGSFDSTYISDDFAWRELGIFCKGEDGLELLYAYSNDGESAGTLKANATDVLAEQTIALVIAVGDAEHVTALLSGSVIYATKKEFDEHLNNKNNPHQITKETIGLDNVQNVSPSDATVEYTESEDLIEPYSGEKASTFYGKVKKAISSLLLHLKEDNPHGITTKTISAAKDKHSHSAADITSGILSANRGGTGASSLRLLRESIIDVGSYIGDGTQARKIELGYTPRAVLLMNKNGFTNDDINGCYGGMAKIGCVLNCKKEAGYTTFWDDKYSVLSVTETGFRVNFYIDNKVFSNVENNTYIYLAFK